MLIGSEGRLGTDLNKVLVAEGHEVSCLTHREDINLASPISVASAFHLPTTFSDIVINAAAYNHVDDAELYADKAFDVNAVGVKHLAKECRKHNLPLIHFSTDYVFPGYHKRPYHEEDRMDPINTYGASKAAGEMMLRLTWEKHYIIRTCGLYGANGSSDFVSKMLSYDIKAMLDDECEPIRIVNDQIVTPTPTIEIARLVALLIKTDMSPHHQSSYSYGTYHATCRGQCSWYEFATAIFEIIGNVPPMEPVTSEKLQQVALRPKYSVLENGRLKFRNMNILPHWRDALTEHLTTAMTENGEGT